MDNQEMEQGNLVKVGHRRVGEIVGDSFIKRVIGSKHMLRIPRAWCMDAGVFDEKVKPNCKKIIIKDTESGLTYKTSTNTFDAFKGVTDRGYGKQYFLAMGRWNIVVDGGSNGQN